MDVLERWDRHNQGWADRVRRDPNDPGGIRAIRAIGLLYAVATAIAIGVGEPFVAALSGAKAVAFLTIARVTGMLLAHRRRAAAAADRTGQAAPSP